MNKSESLKNFAAAMCLFQGEVKNPPKSADNPFFKSKYTTLDVLIDTAKPLLQKNGLSYLQSCSGDGSNIIVTTLLMHNSGEWIESDPLTLKADKATAQGAGSAITYARRYALAAALGLASDEDDDGNGAEPKKPQNGAEPKRPQNSAQGNKPVGNGNNAPEPQQGGGNDAGGSEKASKEQVNNVFAAAANRKKEFPDFDLFKLLDELVERKQITTKFTYTDNTKTKIKWTQADILAIMTELEMPF